jgi:hypothetical protein
VLQSFTDGVRVVLREGALATATAAFNRSGHAPLLRVLIDHGAGRACRFPPLLYAQDTGGRPHLHNK